MKRLGERIRRKREGLHLQLNDLARQTGISPSALSQIENGKAFPSVFRLKAIADCLHTTVGEIIGEYETLSRNPCLRESERKLVKDNGSGSKLYQLSHHDPHKVIETYAVVFEEGSDAKGIMESHPGQQFIHILKGAVEILFDEKKYNLYPGDSFYYYASLPHEVKNIHEGESECIWVITLH